MSFREWWSKNYKAPTAKQKRFCWFLGIPVALCVLVALLLISGRVSGGRFGIVGVDGDSMLEFPNASYVFVVPSIGKAPAFVVAWGSLPRGSGKFNEESTSDDDSSSLMVKLWRGGCLHSTATNQKVTEFELRGKIVSAWNPPWNHSGAASPIPHVAGAFPNKKEKKELNELEEVAKGIKDTRISKIMKMCDPVDFALPDPAVRTWKHAFERPVHMVEASAETPFVLALFSNENRVKDAAFCAPPNRKLTPLFSSLEKPLNGEIELRFEEADPPPPATKLYYVRVWVHKNSH